MKKITLDQILQMKVGKPYQSQSVRKLLRLPVGSAVEVAPITGIENPTKQPDPFWVFEITPPHRAFKVQDASNTKYRAKQIKNETLRGMLAAAYLMVKL